MTEESRDEGLGDSGGPGMHLILCSLVMSSSSLGTRVVVDERSLETWRCMTASKSWCMSETAGTVYRWMNPLNVLEGLTRIQVAITR